MASKQYVSIIRLFQHCDIPFDDGFNSARTKKQLQAEFGFARDGFIEVDGYTYTRHDVFEELDHAGFEKRLVFHRQIWRKPTMLGLLENNTADLSLIGTDFKPFSNNSDFDEFISPYFAGPFNYISRTLLQENDMQEVGYLLSCEGFLLAAEREEAFRPLRIFLDENERTLRNVTLDNYKLMRPRIEHWIENDWYLFLSNLPDEFYEAKENIATLFINLSVAIQKKHRKDCRMISEQLVGVHGLAQHLRNIISSNHLVYSGASSSSGGGGSKVGWFVAFIIFTVIRLGLSEGCNSTSNTNYEYTPIKYEISDSMMKMLDSSAKGWREKSGVK